MYLGCPDLGIGADQAPVARARQHTPACDGGTVDRGHSGPRVAEHRVKRVRQGRNQPVGVAGPALQHPVEVDPGAEHPAGTGDHQRATARSLQLADGFGQLVQLRAAIIGPEPATDLAVRVQSGDVSGTGALDASGRATAPLVDTQRRSMTESAAWNHDWPTTSVVIGADVPESRRTRDRVRAWARQRLDQPPDDAFLAEILAAESSY